MGRKPCCEKMGLKKGPWSVEEDHILTNYINLHGHSNWRALPKQAGLLRCGKSCRLRWTNYLRPDIKRGNFSHQEEQTIIELHQQLGNRWSTIAAKLPGRTDNEIKNVWHTHLKKKLKQHEATCAQQSTFASDQKSTGQQIKDCNSRSNEILTCAQPQQSSSSDVSSFNTAGGDDSTAGAVNSSSAEVGSPENFPDMDEDFWSEVLSADNSGAAAEAGKALRAGFDNPELELPFISWDDQFFAVEPILDDGSTAFDGMDFWFDMLKNAGGLSDMSEMA